MNNHYQLVIIGAGPAGISAATIAAEYGIDFALFDEQPALGGQIYRAIETIPDKRAKLLGEDYLRGKKLAEAFRQRSLNYFPDTQVWSLSAGREIGLLHNHQAKRVTADQILVANGAMERPVPFPGWTLPGVMYAGAGQVLFKSAGVVPEEGVVLAGSGPLSLLLAWQYLQAGVEIKALLDMTPTMNHVGAIFKLPRALRAHHYLTKGLSLQRDLKRAGVPIFTGVSELQAEGEEHIQTVRFRHRGQTMTLETTHLLTHFGVIPHVWLTQSAGCKHDWDRQQQCWRPQLDSWGSSTIDGILVAGDGAGIGGARIAEHAGRIAAIQAMYALGQVDKVERRRLTAEDQRMIAREQAIRPFLETYFYVPLEKMIAALPDKTLICRCEEVTAGDVRTAVSEGHGDSNQVKFKTRCGMGPCQGRQCANAVAQLVAVTRGISVPEAGLYRGRPPVTPLTLGQLADLDEGRQE